MTVDSEPACTIQDPETEAAKWKLACVYFISYTCAFLTVTCKNVYKKGLYADKAAHSHILEWPWTSR